MSFFDKVKGALTSGREELTRRRPLQKQEIYAGYRRGMRPYRSCQ